MKTLILGKRSFLSQELKFKISSSKVINYEEFNKFIHTNKKKFNLIINSFYPSSKLNNIKSYNDFYTSSIGKISKILDKIDSKRINKIIYTSSAAIYGSIQDKENKDDNNRLLYSSTKLLNEILLNNFCKKKKIQLIIARVFNMYGSNDNFSIINKLDLKKLSLKDLLLYLINFKIYKNNPELINLIFKLIESYFYYSFLNKKNLDIYKFYEYFIKKIDYTNKFNLDLESLFIEFKNKVTNE